MPFDVCYAPGLGRRTCSKRPYRLRDWASPMSQAASATLI